MGGVVAGRVVAGGFGSAVMETLGIPVLALGLPTKFIEHGKRADVLAQYGLGAEGIARQIKEKLHS